MAAETAAGADVATAEVATLAQGGAVDSAAAVAAAAARRRVVEAAWASTTCTYGTYTLGSESV